MNILIDINHPAHVHLLRNVYFDLQSKGHQIIVTIKDVEVIKDLLKLYGIPYINIGRKNDALALKGLDQFLYDWNILRLVHRYNIDVGIGSSINVAHVSRISRMHSIILDDDDDDVEPLFVKYAHPFADIILSPDSIVRKARKTIYYPGTHELAYLHPCRFVPNPSVLTSIGIKIGEPFFILRFNAFKAHHDIGVRGLSIEDKRRLIKLLEPHGRVIITTERNIDDEFLLYKMSISQDQIHNLLYYATMFIGDSQTMTSEAALLGTPAIKCNSFAGRLAVPNEIEQRYGLCYSFMPEQVESFFEKIEELLSLSDLKEEWHRRRALLLANKIDVTAFLTWFVEGYPQTIKKVLEYQRNDIWWQQFR